MSTENKKKQWERERVLFFLANENLDTKNNYELNFNSHAHKYNNPI